MQALQQQPDLELIGETLSTLAIQIPLLQNMPLMDLNAQIQILIGLTQQSMEQSRQQAHANTAAINLSRQELRGEIIQTSTAAIAELRGEIIQTSTAAIAELRGEIIQSSTAAIAELRQDTTTAINGLRQGTIAAIGGLRQDTIAAIGGLQQNTTAAIGGLQEETIRSTAAINQLEVKLDAQDGRAIARLRNHSSGFNGRLHALSRSDGTALPVGINFPQDSGTLLGLDDAAINPILDEYNLVYDDATIQEKRKMLAIHIGLSYVNNT